MVFMDIETYKRYSHPICRMKGGWQRGLIEIKQEIAKSIYYIILQFQSKSAGLETKRSSIFHTLQYFLYSFTYHLNRHFSIKITNSYFILPETSTVQKNHRSCAICNAIPTHSLNALWKSFPSNVRKDIKTMKERCHVPDIKSPELRWLLQLQRLTDVAIK